MWVATPAVQMSLTVLHAFIYSKTPHRSSAAAAYSTAGALQSSIETRIGEKTHSNSTSEINTSSADLYGRPVPLPITTPADFSPTSIHPSPIREIQTNSNPCTQSEQMSVTNEMQLSAASTCIGVPATNIASSTDGQLSAFNIVASPSVIEASKLRSQFGFGSNHVVPSVPLPLPTSTTTSTTQPQKRSHPNKKNNPTNIAVLSKTPQGTVMQMYFGIKIAIIAESLGGIYLLLFTFII